MIQWARLNEDGIIIDVTISQDYTFGEEWLRANFGGEWRELPDDGRGVGIGGTWDSVRQAFIPFKAYPSWILNDTDLIWEAPIPRPEGDYTWDEQAGAWVEVTNETA